MGLAKGVNRGHFSRMSENGVALAAPSARRSRAPSSWLIVWSSALPAFRALRRVRQRLTLILACHGRCTGSTAKRPAPPRSWVVAATTRRANRLSMGPSEGCIFFIIPRPVQALASTEVSDPAWNLSDVSPSLPLRCLLVEPAKHASPSSGRSPPRTSAARTPMTCTMPRS